jgi:hypothetical protein
MSAGQPFGTSVAINPNTGNPVIRTTPDHAIKRVFARNGEVVIVGEIGGQEVERIIERKEAIHRAQALSDMAKKARHDSDHKELISLVEGFIAAIKQAKEQAGGQYKSTSVSMFIAGKNN